MTQSTPPKDELLAIRQAAEGLEYPSESDAAFEVFRWPGASAASARDAVKAQGPKDAKLEEVKVESFFGQLDQTSDATRFRKLLAALQATLTNLAVFRVGEVNVTIYVV